MPVARVPYNDPARIQRGLDAGALGITVPSINTPEEARRIVRDARYAAVGERSYGSSRVPPASTAITASGPRKIWW